jgi:nucleotide-binding universal stress UspA family protein
MEFQRLVVGFDGSPEARVATRWALARARGGEVRVVLVTGDDGRDLGAVALGDEVGDLARELGGSSEFSTDVIESTDIAEALTTSALRTEAQAVVLGARYHQRWHPHRVSSVAAYVHHHSAVPMITVRAPTGDDHQICVGVDGSDKSGAALRWIAARASAQDHIRATWIVGEGIDPPALPVKSMAILVRAVESYLRQEISEIVDESIASISSEVKLGFAANELIEAASDCSILAVGHEHYRPIRRIPGRSVSLQLLREFDRTTIVVP